ncbi:MAG: flagellar hook-basal body complex protein FliE [Synergistales bacterium]
MSGVSMVNLGLLREARFAYGVSPPAKGDSPAEAEDRAGQERVSPFDEVLRQGLEKVNQTQVRAERAMKALATGDVDDISEVAAAVSEAEMALRFAVQVRDRLLDAYNQLVRMSG